MTKYNVLYNGNLAFEEGVQDLAKQYEDNFWNVLPIEPLQIKDDVFELEGKLKKEDSKTPFDIAEEKAVKAVQKHGMRIEGKEYNKQIDDAYLLLGKSRYYSQRFVPALEAFEYVLKRYAKGGLKNDLKVWSAKTKVRLENEEQAIRLLKDLLLSKNLKDYIKEEAYTALAMAYLALDSIPQTIKALNKATLTQENPTQYTRNLFVLGQLYRKAENIDSSQIAFKQILNYRKSPYKYKVHAYVEQAKNATDSTDNAVLKEDIAKLLSHYENRSYYDVLYYQSAQLDFIDKKDTLALEKLKKSVQTPLAKDFQKGISYEAIGNYYFDKAKFITAGAYYDSVIPTVTNENTRRIRKLKRKRKSLEEVIYYETILTNNDSIFRLINMDTIARKSYFEDYVKKLKRADEIRAIQKENAERSQGAGEMAMGNEGFGRGSKEVGGRDASAASKWYFYNTQTVGFGKATFQKIWGNRKLQDNWRLSDKATSGEEDFDADNILNTVKIDESKKYDIAYYLDKIPSDTAVIAKMRDKNAKSLYQLGLIYKEKFKEYPLAIARLERFLTTNPSKKQILPAKYHLYKIYKTIDDKSKTAQLKQEILSEYPDSRYASIIQNPNEVVSQTTESTPEGHYEKVYCDYDFFEKYQSVFEQCELAINQYKGEPIQPKFELLKSFAILKLEGKKPFIKSLEYVVGNFPKTTEGERAQEILDMLNGVKRKPKEKKKTFKEKREKDKNTLERRSSKRESKRLVKPKKNKARKVTDLKKN